VRGIPLASLTGLGVVMPPERTACPYLTPALRNNVCALLLYFLQNENTRSADELIIFVRDRKTDSTVDRRVFSETNASFSKSSGKLRIKQYDEH